ncbi:beta-propeller fold lactonase family protein [Bacillus sp. DX1.1]|uniref:lactonase family protein n=1 Tax=unclassified Bacillus (in: firmicutes) TaxID=185979 RepID=UPI002571303C|nr:MULTISPECIES: beta-propeller fold lactonase family protein [unclassified Bacillus (in: firmicutes)]MDM5153166.1 beta-propeller fold lactonase family protein [Bacillus sp. DX1.1]WJE82134.1 beta-propeller fold lactonase family protein [Bacillus sp. DX3.1]
MQIMNKYFRASMVYIMTNNEVMNQIIAFYRDMNGMLTFAGSYPTYGRGTGTKEVSTATANDGVDPLAAQGALTLSRDGRFLLAVNAGSNSISSFIITDSGAPVLVDMKPSGGAQPNSVDVFGNLVYVSNVGNAANNFASNITGFRIDTNGRLTPIPKSTHSLSTFNAQPAQVLFTPDGSKILVSELTSNHLSIFHVNKNSTITGPIVNDSYGQGPLGAYFLSSGILLVTEAVSNALSSYSLTNDGILHVISGSVPNGYKTACWVVTTRDERFAYTTNTLSGTISTYRIDPNGALSVVRHITSTPSGTVPGLPIDAGVSKDGRHFYTLNGNQGTVSVFNIQDDGSLVRLQVAVWTDFPYFGSQGLAVL